MGDKRVLVDLAVGKQEARERSNERLRDDAYGQLHRARDESAKNNSEQKPEGLLMKAQQTNEKQGFAAAKPIFEKAIASADKIDTNLADTKSYRRCPFQLRVV